MTALRGALTALALFGLFTACGSTDALAGQNPGSTPNAAVEYLRPSVVNFDIPTIPGDLIKSEGTGCPPRSPRPLHRSALIPTPESFRARILESVLRM
ncbi:MAG: hypothetical protein IT384_02745 [Deltaproteobacteria bacterium]|nr:hypothetical protein [Deltaproteobacteria bacterium]